MENKIILVLILSVLASCKPDRSKYTVVYTATGSGWDVYSTQMRCDSATMINEKTVVVYYDGRKSTIYADKILINVKEY
jgi:MinD superfamily P-loop ATPase